MPRLLIFSLLMGAIAAWLAEKKGRNWALWGVLTALFPFMIVLVLILPPVLTRGLTRRCPNCSGIIRQDQDVCAHCGKEMPIEMVQCRSCGKYVPDKEYCIECNRPLHG